jgi:hypothetical protein
MELCSIDLKQYITEMPFFRDRRKLLEIFKEICNGIHYMHHVKKSFHRYPVHLLVIPMYICTSQSLFRF